MREYFKPPNILTVNDSFNWQGTNELVILKISLALILGPPKNKSREWSGELVI